MSARFLPRHTLIKSDAGKAAPRSLTSDDYPLVEISPEPGLGGYWLYLHVAPGVGAETHTVRFVPEGESLPLMCSQMLGSHYCRTTPPELVKSSRPVAVYTAADHLAR